MTKQLYYKSRRKLSFEANIILWNQNGTVWETQLDETYFYPEGGGQPGDIGFIDNIKVLDVIKDSGRILHILESEPRGGRVKCIIDKNHRELFMRQHTAQHLVSGILKKELDINTLSVHLSTKYITIEIERSYIGDNEIEILEDKVLEMIQSNNAITYHLTNSKELHKFNIRRSSSLNRDIRIVEIDGYDMVPCGGVHLDSVGQIGMAKITGYEKIRGNIRLSIITGKDCLRDYREKQRSISNINTLLYTKDGEVVQGVEKLKTRVSTLTFEKLNLEKFIVSSEVDKLLNISKRVKIYSDLPKGVCKSIAGKLKRKLNKPLLIIDESEKLNWFLIDSLNSKVDFEYFKNNLLPIINGRGGGNEIWQGSGEKMKIMEFAEKTSNYLATD